MYRSALQRKHNISVQIEDENSLHATTTPELQQPIGSSEIDDLLPISVSLFAWTIASCAEAARFSRKRDHLNPVAAVQRPLRRPQVQKRDWAHVVDINKPMNNFKELVPEMAHKVTQRSLSDFALLIDLGLIFYSILSSWTLSKRRRSTILRWETLSSSLHTHLRVKLLLQNTQSLWRRST